MKCLFNLTSKLAAKIGALIRAEERAPTAMVNHYYCYGLDADFGPFFLKFSSYFPYNAKLCINGHEYAKRQLAKEKIAFEALDNGGVAPSLHVDYKHSRIKQYHKEGRALRTETTINDT